MKNHTKFLDVAPTRFDIPSMPFEIFLFTILSIFCFAIFICMLIFSIKQWKNYKEQKGTKKKFIIAISISAVFALLFVLGCLIVVPDFIG